MVQAVIENIVGILVILQLVQFIALHLMLKRHKEDVAALKSKMLCRENNEKFILRSLQILLIERRK